MKKPITTFLLVCLFSSVLAKNSGTKFASDGTFSIGLRVGFTLPTYWGGGSLPEGGSRWINPGHMGGLIVCINVNELFSIQPEFQFIQGGFNQKFKIFQNSDFVEYDINAQYGYLQMPILAKLRFGDDNIKFSFNAGPYIGLSTGGTIDTKYRLFGSPYEISRDLKVQRGGLSAFDVGAVLGTGVQLVLGPGQIVGDIRCNIGFIDIFNSGSTVSGGTKSSYNFVPNFSLGYVFVFGY